MLNFLSKILGGNKSEKDVKKIAPQVEKINSFFAHTKRFPTTNYAQNAGIQTTHDSNT